MKQFVCIVMMLLIPTSSTLATDYVYNNTSGYYTYNGGNYNRYWVNSYVYCGTQYGYWQYSYVSPIQSVKTITYDTPNVDALLIDLAKNRDNHVAAALAQQAKKSAFVEKVNALGLTGNFRWDGYNHPGLAYNGLRANLPGYGYTATITQGTYGANGNSIYGYNPPALAEAVDMNQLFRAYATATQQAQATGTDAVQAFATLIGQQGGNQAKVAEYYAKAAAGSQLLKAFESSGNTQTTFQFQRTPDGAIQARTVDAPSGDVRGNPLVPGSPWQQDAVGRCGSCHSGVKKEGGFDITSWPGLPYGKKLEYVQTRFHPTADKKLFMPKDGKPWTDAQLKLWLQ